MAVTSHSVAFQKTQKGFISFPHWVALNAECATLFGMRKSTGSRATSRGRPTGSYWHTLNVHPVVKLLLFFCYHSIHWKFADSLRRCVRRVISILSSLQMVKHWPSPEIRRESSQSTRSQFPEEKNDVLPRVLHTRRVLRGLLTVAK